jgi:hypothetical protein
MSAVQLALKGERTVRVPLVADPFWIGRDASCDLCLWDLRVSRKHARVARVRGEYLLSSEGRHGVYFGGERVPVLTLRDGDEVTLTPPDQPDPVRIRFENALEGVFVPPGVAVSSVWAQKLAGQPRVPGTFGRYALLDPRAEGTQHGAHIGRERDGGAEVVVKLLSPVADGAAADAWFLLVAAMAGVRHPALPVILEAGIVPTPQGLQRWIAMEPVKGRTASHRIAEGPQPPVTVVRRLRMLAAGLHLLHSRDVVHGGVTPSNVILRPDGGATLVGGSRAFIRREAVPREAIARGESVFIAPEALVEGTLGAPSSDVFGLAALGRAMLTGHSDRTLAEAGIVVPAPLEDGLARALSENPSERPTAEDLGQVLAFAEASLSRASA